MSDTQDPNKDNVETTQVSTPDTTAQNDASVQQRATLPQDAEVAPAAQDTEVNPTANQMENAVSAQVQQVNPQAPQVITSNQQQGNTSVVVSPVQTEVTTERITADGRKEYPLQNEPVSIHSVSVNGQVSNLGLSTDANAVNNAVVYDLEKNALVFANEVQGAIEVTYTHAPEIAKNLTTKILASLHDRLARVEALVKRWEGANL